MVRIREPKDAVTSLMQHMRKILRTPWNEWNIPPAFAAGIQRM
jgi:hypothetical protein